MKLEIDFKVIEGTDLTLNEFILLRIVYFNRAKELILLKHLGYIDFLELERRGWLKFNQKTHEIVLREQANLLFRLDHTLFDTFFQEFPEHTPNGRQLRTGRVNTIIYRDAKKIWNNLFKGNPEEAKQALETLRTEKEFRTLTNDMEYFSGIINWLEKGNYQTKYDLNAARNKNAPITSVNGFDDF